MEKLVIKKWINGKFQEVKSYSVYEVQKIRHHEFGLEIVLNGRTRLYGKQCEIEFKQLSEEEPIVDLADTPSIPALVMYEKGKVVKVETGF